MQKLHKLEQLIFKKTNKNFDTQVENFKLRHQSEYMVQYLCIEEVSEHCI